jgi:AraC-like DNA-binding protein
LKIISEHVALSAEHPYVISCFQGNEVSLDYPCHYHTQAYELTLTLGLNGTRLVGDDIASFQQKDLVLLAPGIPHAWYGPKHAKNEVKLIVWQFGAGFPGVPPQAIKDLQPIATLLQKAERGILFQQEIIEPAYRLLNLALNGSDVNKIIYLIQLLKLLSDSVNPKLLCSAGYSFRGNQQENTRFEKVHSYVLAHFREKMYLEEVASIANLSPTAFSHYFKKRTLRSFTAFVNELRLAEVARLLITTDHPIANLALSNGFQNLSLFNRLFLRKYKVSPSAYRQLAEV